MVRQLRMPNRKQKSDDWPLEGPLPDFSDLLPDLGTILPDLSGLLNWPDEIGLNLPELKL